MQQFIQYSVTVISSSMLYTVDTGYASLTP